MKEKYVIEYTYYEEDGFRSKLYMHKDNPELNGLYVPKNCYVIRLFTREAYETRMSPDTKIYSYMTEEEKKIFTSYSGNEYKSKYDEMLNAVGEHTSEFLSFLFATEPLKEVYIGEIFTKEDFEEMYGEGSLPCTVLDDFQAKGVIYYDTQKLYKYLDYYYENSNIILGGLSYDGKLEISKEDEYQMI